MLINSAKGGKNKVFCTRFEWISMLVFSCFSPFFIRVGHRSEKHEPIFSIVKKSVPRELKAVVGFGEMKKTSKF